MSQETNLNVAPYFDDFDANNDYYKVLFKPGYPVQARELTTLQSILQNQVEKFGQHFFKEGAKVIPGNTAYSASYNAVELENVFLGIPITDYINQLIGAKITGETSGVTAVVDKVLMPTSSERGSTTLYVSYLGSNSEDKATTTFADGELISSNVALSAASTIISANEPFANAVTQNATSVGSAFSISNGVYFAKGTFVNVSDETLILDQYTNIPSYRIGLLINEEIINSDIDASLNDNSRGFNNYSAPGADRLKISTSLFKKALDDFDDNNFIELATVNEGVLRTKKKGDYSLLEDTLARRTYAESGDYYIRAFDLTTKESLNNNRGNRGVFNSSQLTYNGSSPEESLGLYQMSPGKAFIKGYEVETIAPTYIDFPKPRTTKTLKNQAVNYKTGSTLRVNAVHGHPTVGLGNTFVLSLRDSRVGETRTSVPGKEIGLARVYDFNLNSGAYNSNNLDLNEFNLALYDVQTFSEIHLNEPITLSTPTFIKGNNSGATAFISTSVAAGTALTVYDRRGDFVANESFSINGINNTRVAIAVTNFGISDVRAVSSIVGAAATFTADTIQTESVVVGVASIFARDDSNGTSKVSSTANNFPGTLRVGNLVKFSNLTSSNPVFASVVAVGSSDVTITGVTTITGVCDGAMPGAAIHVQDFGAITTPLEGAEDNSFYTKLSRDNVANVDLTSANITIRKSFDVNISSNQLTSSVQAGNNETFLPYSADRYELIRANGTIEALTSDKVSITNGGSVIQIYNLSNGDDDATLVATLNKIKPKSKVKLKNRVSTIVVDKSVLSASGIGATTLNDGLTFGSYPHGTNVQDEKISLNTPDVLDIHAVFESVDTSDASAPTFVMSSLTGPTGKTSDLIIGESVRGKDTGAVGQVAELLTDSKISFISGNNKNFKEGEILIFAESEIQAVLVTIDTPSINISSEFTFTNGQRSSFYNYGFITRKSGKKAPYRKLKIYFSSAYYQTTDDGDITTADSYTGFDYIEDIQTVNSVRNTDILDIRPRVSEYTVTENARSPFEFHGRTFTGAGDTASNILASNESISIDFSFYLGRIDRVFLTKDGRFQVKYGAPSENPQKPGAVDDAIEVATIKLPAYLYDTSQASVKFLDHKRFRMVDIKNLENRIKNLEYYTSLSLLETNTSNLFVSDSKGLNRFKSGFFVDNFSSFLTQEESVEFKNSVDIKNKQLRPQHHTDLIDLQGNLTSSSDDLQFATPEGTNVTKNNDIVTLDYTEVEWLKQTFATRTESVTPFLISFWNGSIELTPTTDTWVDTVRIEAKIVDTEGNYAETLALASRTLNVDPQNGFAPTIWNSWETNWSGQDIIEDTRIRTVRGGENANVQGPGGRARTRSWRETVTDQVIEDTILEVRDTGVQSRTGTRTVVTEQFDTTSTGDRSVSRDLISFMRSRNIQFVAKRIKPSTQMYGFFDGVDVTKYCVPKLLEITMISGAFQVGETVVGRTRPVGNQPLNPGAVDARITFRAATSNHKEGPYNSPLTTFKTNPYTTTTLPASYSSTSQILNVDTFSLSNQSQGTFSGFVETGMIMVGQTSGAQATISNVRLISDISATLIGSFFLPNPNNNTNPRFEAGQKVFTLVNNENNNQNNASSIAEEGYISSGTLETVQETIISVRNARIENKTEFEDRAVARTTGASVVASNTISTQQRERTVTQWYDPLAQSFLVDDETGVFLTKCDVFFASKDDVDIPITFQLREMKGGVPTQRVIPFSEVILEPSQVNTSTDGSVATTFTFKAPVYLEGGGEYAIALASISTKYSAYISRIGENDLITQTFISNQPYLGSLFKSQNASTWEPSQWEDLKFTLYRADFVTNGSVEFYSPELTDGNKGVAHLMQNSLNFNSREIRVGINSTLQDTDIKLGNTVRQLTTNATGDYVGNAGIATGTLQVINSGIGYTPSADTLLFGSVPLTSVTGNGRNAKANITINNGVAIAATITESGTGYVIGDVLGIGTIGTNNLGLGARLSVQTITNVSELILQNVQGNFAIAGTGKTVMFDNNAGITTQLNAAQGGNVQIFEIEVDNDGQHVVVDHKNHGMYFSNNFVTISDVHTDVQPVKLAQPFDATSTSPLQVDATTNLNQFENVGVGTTNLGYVLIGDEIVSYSSASGTTIGGEITRGVDNTLSKNYPAGTPVYKYELDSVSLRRINKTHNLANVTVANPITFDSYNIKLDMGSSGVGRSTSESHPILYAGETKTAGGSVTKATQNIPFEIVHPIVQTLTVPGTTLSAEMRTVSATSISGNEIPYVNQGFESISLNKTNYFSTPRLVASKVNETAKLAGIPGNKSMNLRINLGTVDSRLSPVIDTQRVSTILTSNRVNSVIDNYATDNRVNSIKDDPTAFQYLSKEITLENASTSIKILANAHVGAGASVRAFFAIGEDTGFEPIFVPFPGFNNLNERGEVINVANNDGLSDSFVSPTENTGFTPQETLFREYTFTADELPSFTSYRIKIVMTSTSQVHVPKLSDLRVIALA